MTAKVDTCPLRSRRECLVAAGSFFYLGVLPLRGCSSTWEGVVVVLVLVSSATSWRCIVFLLLQKKEA